MVASIRMATVTRKPTCPVLVAPLLRKDAKTIAISNAAAAMIRPSQSPTSSTPWHGSSSPRRRWAIHQKF